MGNVDTNLSTVATKKLRSEGQGKIHYNSNHVYGTSFKCYFEKTSPRLSRLPSPLPRHVLLTLYVVFLSSLFCKGCFRSQFHFFSLLWSRHVSIYTFLGFVSFLEPGKKANGHVKYNYLFPEAAANRFSILFVIKNGFTGNLIKLFATSDLVSVTHLFRVSLTKSSLSVHNDNGENVSYNLEETYGTWRQLALSVEDDSLILYTSCKETSSRFLKRNLTLWNKVHVVVGEEAHKHNEVASL